MSPVRGSNVWFRVALFGAALVSAGGCGPSVGELTGKVTHNDKVLHSGTVLVLAADGSSHTGPIQEDGTYSVANVPAGAVSVGVTSPDPKSMVIAQRKEKNAPKTEATRPNQKEWFPIPDKYSEPKSSGLTTTVKSGKNEFPIQLK